MKQPLVTFSSADRMLWCLKQTAVHFSAVYPTWVAATFQDKGDADKLRAIFDHVVATLSRDNRVNAGVVVRTRRLKRARLVLLGDVALPTAKIPVPIGDMFLPNLALMIASRVGRVDRAAFRKSLLQLRGHFGFDGDDFVVATAFVPPSDDLLAFRPRRTPATPPSALAFSAILNDETLKTSRATWKSLYTIYSVALLTTVSIFEGFNIVLKQPCRGDAKCKFTDSLGVVSYTITALRVFVNVACLVRGSAKILKLLRDALAFERSSSFRPVTKTSRIGEFSWLKIAMRLSVLVTLVGTLSLIVTVHYKIFLTDRKHWHPVFKVLVVCASVLFVFYGSTMYVSTICFCEGPGAIRQSPGGRLRRVPPDDLGDPYDASGRGVQD
ncbi:hypothetical protein MTO96_012448 [Rhipicephalus appendiculatus]